MIMQHLTGLSKAITSLLIIASCMFASSFAVTAAAAPTGGTSSGGQACKSISQLGNGQTCTTGSTSVASIAKGVVSFISVLAGIIAVIMIIVAGLRFITANGDSNGISRARTALFYAAIGLAVAALAQVLVLLVINRIANPGS